MKPLLKTHGFTLIELLVVIAIIGALVAILLPAVQSAREAARRSMCTNQLKQWSLAMLTYEDANKALPYIANRANPAGSEINGDGKTTYRGWVVALWPFIEQSELYDRWNFDRAHNDTGATPIGGMRNNTLSQQRLSTYYCPSDKPGAYHCTRNATFGTSTPNCAARQNYVVNGGRAGLLQATGSANPAPGNQQQAAPSSPFGFRGGSVQSNFVPFKTKLAQITDGTSQTLLMAEIRVFPVDVSSNDTDTRGVVISGLTTGFTTHATPNSGIDTTYSLGGCDNTFDPVNLPCSSPGGNISLSHSARSRHPGGVNVSMCDGTVRFVQNTISLNAWQELSTMNSGLTVPSY
jgi:prepilin-type N-terminal cleavage/methylation domain-containing protein/prepilin-type processing-associated H-X9-DG protein